MGAGGARIHIIHPGTAASPEEGFHTLGGCSLSPSSRGLARDRNSTSHASQQIPLKPQDPNRGNDDPDQDPPQISSQISFDWVSVEREAMHPVGGKLSYFVHNWMRYQRSMGLENYTGLRTPIRDHPPTHLYPPALHFNQETTRILSNEVLELEAKGAISGRWHGLCQPIVPCPQARWDMETSNQSQVPKQTCCGTSLQDGDNSDSEGSYQTQGLALEARSERCLPSSANPPKAQEVPSLPLAGPDMAISGPTIWSEQCPLHIHEAHKAFSAIKAEYVVVAEQAHPLGPAYSLPNYFYPAAYKLSTCFDHHSILYRI